MADYTTKQIDDMEGAFGGGLKKARAELGVELVWHAGRRPAPQLHRLPRTRSRGRGQEEVYSVMRGSGEIDVEGERIPLTPDILVRVGPATKRKIYSGPDGLRLLALGGTPGAAYEAAEFTELASA